MTQFFNALAEHSAPQMPNSGRLATAAVLLFASPSAQNRKRLGLAAAALLFASAATAHEFKLGDLDIKHPWSRATLPGAKVATGYLTVKNSGATPDRLVSITADIAGKAEIHEMSVTDGVMSMRPLKDGVEIPGNGEARLEPGSYHIMFLDLKAPAVEGVKFKGTLNFEKAGSVAVEFAVDKAGGEDHSNHGG